MESGLNDGPALPFVIIFLATSTHDAPHPGAIALEMVLGLVVGVAVAGAITLAWRLHVLTAEPRPQAWGR